MEKMKKRFLSMKWSLFLYLPICFIFAFFGSMAIGIGSNELQSWYEQLHEDVQLHLPPDGTLQLFFDTSLIDAQYITTDGRPFAEPKYARMYFIISNAQVVLIPLWVIFCTAVTCILFYKHELQKPIDILMHASRKISENQLDFSISYNKQNELGQLCAAFDDMRRALDAGSREMWRSLEERKRLNAAFSHDLRTPLTVLKGYADFLDKYMGQISQDKERHVLSLMNGQIERLENYTGKMSAIQKLEDIMPDITEIQADAFREELMKSGTYLCRDKRLALDFQSDAGTLFIDRSLVPEVFENLLSNAARYAESEIRVNVLAEKGHLTISVQDDGVGFSEDALRLAAEPFYREDKTQNNAHFGLGLYICRIICEKCGGSLRISNTETGGRVCAEFICKSR